jgi:hypothetical protein
MKATKFKATTHSCSVCCYRSLIKTQVQHHVNTRKCQDAKVVTEDRIVSHCDDHDSEIFKATLYQYSKCFYTTYQNVKIKTHVSKSCAGADIVSSKRILCFEDVSKETNTASAVVASNGSIAANEIVNSFNTTIHIHLPPGSQDEYTALVSALVPLLNEGKLVLSGDLSTIPAQLSSLTRNADTRLDNKHITNNDVVNRVDFSATPAAKHSKKELHRLMSALYDAMRSKIDLDVFSEPDIDIDDVIELRRQLLPVFYQGNYVDILDDDLTSRYRPDDTITTAEEEGIFPDSEFYQGCRLLVENPKEFRTLSDDIQKQVRVAAKKYLSSLPVERKTRPTNLISTS